MPDFKLPDLGEGVTEGEIDRWLVKEGDVVAEDDLLVEVITDKATAEIPSPYAGVVSSIHVAEGEVVPVGTVLISIEPEGAQAAPAPPPPPAQGQTQEVETRVASAPAPDSDGDGRVLATPPVRKLARDLGIDITRVSGTGPEGRIRREDVESLSKGGGAAPAETKAAAPTGRREPLRGVRRMIAERMAEAHRAIPSVTHVEECDVTELDATRRFANERSPQGPKLTYLPFIIKAAIAGLKEFPALNSTLDEAAGEIVYHDRFDIGVAVDTPSGLLVPTVTSADTKSLRAIAGEIEGLAERGRAGTLKPEELRGSTFTVTSPGPLGGLMATPIIFHPQAAILGVHRAVDRPVVRDGQVVVRKMMNISVTFDHRILDGVTSAKFILTVVRLLEHPAVLALEA